jgi:hypothetical protein
MWAQKLSGPSGRCASPAIAPVPSRRGFLLPATESRTLAAAHMRRMETRNDPKTRFASDTAGHQMTVLLDQGLYRHLRFARPDSSICWFELITTPNLLTINGDMGTFMFSRLEDMFRFFQRADGDINPSYWGEKIHASSDPVSIYSAKVFTDTIRDAAIDQLDDVDESLHGEALAALEEEVLSYAPAGEQEARNALDRFGHELLEFSDTWEYDFTDYSFRYLWNLYAIVHGIARYRALSGQAAESTAEAA